MTEPRADRAPAFARNHFQTVSQTPSRFSPRIPRISLSLYPRVKSSCVTTGAISS